MIYVIEWIITLTPTLSLRERGPVGWYSYLAVHVYLPLSAHQGRGDMLRVGTVVLSTVRIGYVRSGVKGESTKDTKGHKGGLGEIGEAPMRVVEFE